MESTIKERVCEGKEEKGRQIKMREKEMEEEDDERGGVGRENNQS